VAGVDRVRLGSVFLNVSDIERSRRFYGGLLGLPEVVQPDDHTSVYGLGGDVSLVIHGHGEYAGAAVPPGIEDPGATILFLTVVDVDAAVEALRAAGVTVRSEPTDQPWGARDAAVLDPDGYEVHLTA
jgi:catechol 2,3-dioxygenase-like lactoylglutathione lyase family enzyme